MALPIALGLSFVEPRPAAMAAASAIGSFLRSEVAPGAAAPATIYLMPVATASTAAELRRMLPYTQRYLAAFFGLPVALMPDAKLSVISVPSPVVSSPQAECSFVDGRTYLIPYRLCRKHGMEFDSMKLWTAVSLLAPEDAFCVVACLPFSLCFDGSCALGAASTALSSPRVAICGTCSVEEQCPTPFLASKLETYTRSTEVNRLGTLASTCVHEMMHALGVEHCRDPDCVMRPAYNPFVGFLCAHHLRALERLLGATFSKARHFLDLLAVMRPFRRDVHVAHLTAHARQRLHRLLPRAFDLVPGGAKEPPVVPMVPVMPVVPVLFSTAPRSVQLLPAAVLLPATAAA